MSPRAMMFTAAALLASARSSADVWADGFDAWCGDIVSARPVLPEKETRSQPVLGAVRASACIEGGDARDAIASEALGDVFPDSASWSFAVDADEESVSVATFEAEDGSLNRFAVVEQLGNSRPYFWTAEGLDAAIGQDLAAFVADRCLAGEGSSISMLDGVFAADAVEILDRGKSVSIPFERFHFAFVDDNPSANWAHPCRYVFVAEDFSAFAVLYRNFMPSVLSSETGDEIFLSPVDETGAEIPESLESVKARVYNHAKSLEAESNGMAYGQGDARRSYFVLISGGQMPKMNGIRFWSDTATFYSTLTKKYGVPKEQIKVYMSDGNSTGLDANLASTRSGVTPILVDSPKDLDGDGESDITGAATWNNISECFANYRSWLGPGDQLFVFITSHGFQDGVSGSSNYDSGFCLFDSDGYGEIMDDELADWTEHIECPVAFAIETCHSGGFIDDIVATGKRAIATACRHD
ncbi:MAG: hypothetical protein K6F50_01585, partial [Kiritimatiellae bacterium]|nr:hypothetical protein [Kiritimatiellia bacterium]